MTHRWFPKQAEWWRLDRIVELGERHGTVGPAVIDWLTCEAASNSSDDGVVATGYASIAYFIFADRDLVREAIASAVELGLLVAFEGDDRLFTARLADWDLLGAGYDAVRRERRHRPAIPTSVRRAVMDRDEGRCRHCGSDTDLQLDHVHPWSLGGGHDELNLQVLCGPCNRRKGARV